VKRKRSQLQLLLQKTRIEDEAASIAAEEQLRLHEELATADLRRKETASPRRRQESNLEEPDLRNRDPLSAPALPLVSLQPTRRPLQGYLQSSLARRLVVT